MLDAAALDTTVLLTKNILVASGTATVAGVDISDYIGSVKFNLQYASGAGDGSTTLTINLLGSADNTTFTTLTSPTFAPQTASSGLVEVSAEVDAIGYKYIQARHVVTGTTATFTTALSVTGFKRVMP